MITFFSKEVDFRLATPEQTAAVLAQVCRSYGAELGELTYVFCSDAYLLEINQQYLQHDTYTDIITFDQSDEEGLIEGDIFISVERVRENATIYGVSFEQELHRVLAHGLLHLLGFRDKTAAEKAEMRAAEERALALF